MPTKRPNRRALTPRKNDKCAKCGCLCPERFRLSRVDESNHAISRNAPEYCPDCWLAANPRDAFDRYFEKVYRSWYAYLHDKA